MSGDEIRLVIPAEEDFRPIAHLVTGGLASHHDLTFDDLEDLQVALDAVLGLRDDDGEVTVVLTAAEGVLHASLGPFPPDALQAAEASEGGLDLQRVLETVCDTHEVERRDDGVWLELTKRTAGAAA
ncbi:MAG TPA: hypothetical protein VFA37_00565 [Gaiellaceae bacterium]|nr:hypothetical protein [Gaiellaceae bacterium]